MPPTYFGVEDWGVHQELAGPDGNLEVPIGCFLIQDGERTILVDAGLGPVEAPGIAVGGKLPEELAAAGVRPEDVDIVLFTHMHFDHCGWAVRDGALFFPNATFHFGEQDIDQFVRTETPDAMTAPVINALIESGRVQTITTDGEIAPGISTVHAPGHTLGHRCIVLSSGEERMILLGDSVTCPVQLEESEWGAMSDVDPAMSKRTREALFKELEADGAIAVGAHFPGLEFGRVLRGEGKRYFSL